MPTFYFIFGSQKVTKEKERKKKRNGTTNLSNELYIRYSTEYNIEYQYYITAERRFYKQIDSSPSNINVARFVV